MRYSIVYNSKTGNTALLAQRIKAILPGEDCFYYGPPDAEAAKAPLLFIGFWTDKGSCDQEMADFLEEIHEKQIFLFGTAGFGGEEEYYNRILSRMGSYLDKSNQITGTYMCQGKMPLSVRQGYESVLAAEPERLQSLIDNFDRALPHPNEEDLDRLEQAVKTTLQISK